ncbi:MAG: efflux transporter outer membrane subunit [Puniceicoccales bacterium]|jgi:multidrug efflux system outer membrane protein|nr:efflux transporter outer membrane subunit [Puniceicoccales bacterium]
MRLSKKYLILFSALGLAGCAVGPDYEPPKVDVPEAFRDQPATPEASTESIADLGWWEVYKDERLQELIHTALENNKDLKVAAARVEQSRQMSAQARSQYFPSVTASGGISRGRNQYDGSPNPQGGSTSDDALAVLGATWEIDVWGRIRRLNESAQARYLSSEEGRSGVILSLVGDVAQSYFELLELDLELEIAHRTTESFERSARIFGERRQGGVASRLETSRAEAARAQAAASIPDVERAIAQKENQLSILLGQPPGKIERTVKFAEKLVPPEVPIGIPASLLSRRPDLRASEQNLRAANADIGVAIAEYFPKIGLSTFLGRVSPEVSAFTAGSGNAWSVAGSAAMPIFEAGRITAQVREARARWDEAVAQHDSSVLNALGEVSNALIAREKYSASRVEWEKAVTALNDAVSVSMARYAIGEASYYEVLEAQQELFPAENSLARTRLNHVLSVVQLYRALGGGWQAENVKGESVEGQSDKGDKSALKESHG